jgi:hypothetical protein
MSNPSIVPLPRTLFDTIPGIDPGPYPMPVPGSGEPDPDYDPDIDPDPELPPGPALPGIDPGFPGSIFPDPAPVT